MDIKNLNCKVHLSECKEMDENIIRRPEIKEDIPDLKTLIEELHKIFSYDYVNIQDVQTLMTRYKSNRDDFKQYVKFSHYKYTRNLVDAGNGAFNIMILCWGTNHASPIHDHADSHCFMKLLSGSLEEVRYDWPKNVEPEFKKVQKNKQSGCQMSNQAGDAVCQSDCCQVSPKMLRSPTFVNGMVEISRNMLELDDVCYMSDALGLHRMENPSDTDGAISLHLYCPPFSNCQVFDEGGKPSVAPVTFWSEYGKKVVRKNPANQ
ncbi:cysteine dioxygenase type 1 [Aphomia sociella]